MRRLWAAGTAVVMCLALGGVQAAAQGPEAAGVTVAQDCEDIFATPIVCTWTASDPRVAGTMTHEWSPRFGDAVNMLGWADATLEGPEGNWTGRLYAVWGAEPASQFFAVLSGDGAYEGWQYVASTIDDGSPGDNEWFGVMYEGELPPYGPLEPPAEEPTAATVGPALLQLTFDGESCTYEGPTELIPGSVELLFHNKSDGPAATNMVSIDEGYTIQDVIDDLGPEPSTGHHPSWTREIAGPWRATAPGESHQWEGDLEMGLYAMVCARLSPLGAWFGTGLAVDG